MNPAKIPATTEASFHEADLLRLELRVAKRADKLWLMAGRGRGRDLVHWLQAESEVLGQHFGPAPAIAPQARGLGAFATTS
jgi:hypothetical protein